MSLVTFVRTGLWLLSALVATGVKISHKKALFLEFGDFGIAELFPLSLKWLLEQRLYLDAFA